MERSKYGSRHDVANNLRVSSMLFVNKGQGMLYDHYQVGKSLGRGAFGEVFLCKHYESKDQRAVKWIKKEYLDDKAKEAIIGEINILKTLDHPSIVKVYEYFEDQ